MSVRNNLEFSNGGVGLQDLVRPALKLANPGAATILLTSIFFWISPEMRSMMALHSAILSSAVAPKVTSGFLEFPADAGWFW